MMIDAEYLKKIKLSAQPFGQEIVARLLLFPNYRIFARVDIVLEGVENIPRNENVIFAMNHTDRFNYWPFQYGLRRLKEYPYSSVWVKAKYYRNALLAWGLDRCHLIPVPSMGYLLEELFRRKLKRKMEKSEYRFFKDMIDIKEGGDDYPQKIKETVEQLGDSFFEGVRQCYEEVMANVAHLSRKALFEAGLNLIVFPEGTRSRVLGEGKTGLAQLALHTRKKVIPVGCNNSEEVYRGSLPFAQSGRIVYRIGAPLTWEEDFRDCRIEDDFRLLSRESQERYREQFAQATEIIMKSIDSLLDDKYRTSPVFSKTRT